jgi:hypothetical protein
MNFSAIQIIAVAQTEFKRRARQMGTMCQVFALFGAVSGLAATDGAPGSATPTTNAPGALTAVVLAGPWRAMPTLVLPSVTPNQPRHKDPGVTVTAAALVGVAVDDQAWPVVPVPAAWETYGEAWKSMDGEAVFRTQVTIPAAWVGTELKLELGPVDDFDTTYVQGVVVGRTDISTVGHWAVARNYTVPAQVVTGPHLTIAVRVFDHFGGGGFISRLKPVIHQAQP